MRDETRQAIDRRRAQALDEWLVDVHGPEAEDTEPDVSERITLIEFLWRGRTGAQQVILVSREWLQ